MGLNGHALLEFVSFERGHLKRDAYHLMRAIELDPTTPPRRWAEC